jgi:hypothetical protein
MTGEASVPVTVLAHLSAAQVLAARRSRIQEKAPLVITRVRRKERSCMVMFSYAKEWTKINKS